MEVYQVETVWHQCVLKIIEPRWVLCKKVVINPKVVWQTLRENETSRFQLVIAVIVVINVY